jgi:cytochrome c2
MAAEQRAARPVAAPTGAATVLWLRESERRRAGRSQRLTPLAALGSILVLGGCDDSGVRTRFSEVGDSERGALYIQQTGCGSCHIIPGIDGAEGLVGPPLNHMGKRIFVAGLLPNTPANMVRWLRNPQDVLPGNAMPDMGLNEQQARDIAAYLHSLY